MIGLKKYYFYIRCVSLIFLLSPFLIFAKPILSTEAVVEKREIGIDIDVKLAQFLKVVKNLQNEKHLDGEVLVVRNGQILLNLQSEEIASPDIKKWPQFMIASVSKQFFAVALLKALYESSSHKTEDLKIADVKKQLHFPISRFLPHNASIWDGNMPAWAQEVSLHHLLTHTSGIPNGTDTEEYWNLTDSGKYWYETYHPAKEIIKLTSDYPVLFSPGAKYAYCNTGYVLIAEILETITSLPASIYMQQKLFEPIGLYSTASRAQGRWEELKQDPQLSRLVVPFKYDPRGKQIEVYPLLHSEDISVAKGAGSLVSTSRDLLKWNQSLHKDKTVLPKELYGLLITPNIDNYGYGIMVENTDIGTVLWHGGSIGAYRTLFSYIPEHDLTIIILSNIGADFDKIEEEYKAALEKFRDTISDEEERNKAVYKMILEKYPNTRGFEKISEEFEKIILN